MPICSIRKLQRRTSSDAGASIASNDSRTLKRVRVEEGAVIATLTIRNLDEETRDRLRVVAANAGHSMEEHVRLLIAAEVSNTVPRVGFGTWAHSHYADPTGQAKSRASEVEPPARKERPRPAQLPR